MVMKSLLLLVPVLWLSACSSGASDDAGNVANVQEIRRGPMFGGFDLSAPLRLQGGKAGWQLDLAPGRIQFRAPDGAETPYYPVSPKVQGDHVTYPTQTPDGGPVLITLRNSRCAGVEGKSLQAEVKIGERLLPACATPLPIEQIRYDLYNEAEAVPYNATQ